MSTSHKTPVDAKRHQHRVFRYIDEAAKVFNTWRPSGEGQYRAASRNIPQRARPGRTPQNERVGQLSAPTRILESDKARKIGPFV